MAESNFNSLGYFTMILYTSTKFQEEILYFFVHYIYI